MAATGIVAPTRSAVTSAAVIVLFSAAGSFDPAAGMASAACNRPDDVDTVARTNRAANRQRCILSMGYPRKEPGSAGFRHPDRGRTATIFPNVIAPGASTASHRHAGRGLPRID